MADSGIRVQIMDTTLRDGEQTPGISYAPREKLHIAKALLQLVKVDRVEVASAKASGGEKEAVQIITAWAAAAGCLDRVEILGFVDHTKSVDWIVDAGARVLNLLTKGSEKHCMVQLRKTLAEHLADIEKTVSYARQKGLGVNVYLEDWSNGYADKPSYVYALMEGLQGMGIGHFMLPDTLGVMAPYEVHDSLSDMLTRFPWACFDFHPHNDYGLATSNILYAVRAGVRNVHATMNCLGERAGNSSLAEVAVVLKDKLGAQLRLDESRLCQVSELVENFSGRRVQGNAPIVGEDVFTQTSGVHADGDKKGGLYESPIRPERFRRTRSYALGKMSGKASLMKNLEELGIELSEENLQRVLQRIVALGDLKENVTLSDLPFIITDVLESGGASYFELLECSIKSEMPENASASIRIRAGEQIFTEVGEGNGGYDAFMDAVRQVLVELKFELPELVDYEVRIPRGGGIDALTEANITWQHGGRRLRTIAVSSDQVMAAVNATMKFLNLRQMGGTS